MIKLYTYWRSTAAYRVRIALNIKELEYQSKIVHLVKNGGEQHQESYLAVNPQGLVPALQLEDGSIITQSLAIIEYLEQQYPQPSLFPKQAVAKAQCRAMAQLVAADIHPLNNLRVLQYLRGQDFSQAQLDDWYAHWIERGFTALEKLATARKQQFLSADYPCLADICLVAQVYNARRFAVCLDAYPNLLQIEQDCLALPPFVKAMPENQIDAE